MDCCPLVEKITRPCTHKIRLNVRFALKATEMVRRHEMTLLAINVRFASRRTAAKFASLFDEAGGVVRDMTEIDLTGEHA